MTELTTKLGETLQIEKLIYGRDGLARQANGEVVFVPFSVPGDVLEIERLERKKQVQRGQITKVVTPSPDRINPPCSVFGICGGCDWQHITLSAQRLWKQRIVEESLNRIGKFTDVTVQPTVGVEDGFHYRNKVEWHVKAGKLGYMAAHQHDVVTFDTCWIMPEIFQPVADWFKGDSDRLQGLSRIQVKSNRQGQLLVTVWQNVSEILALQNLQLAVPQITGIVQMVGHETVMIIGEPHLLESIQGKTFQLDTHSFFQVNLPVAEVLVAVMQKQLADNIQTALDLYAGVGLFSILLHERIPHITAIESSPKAVKNFQHSLVLNHIEQGITIIEGEVSHSLTDDTEPVELAIVDPPRQGCEPEVMDWLAKNVTRQILYVSCDPATLARDLKRLCEQGWQIKQVTPFDMFPQTYHIETLVTLIRS